MLVAKYGLAEVERAGERVLGFPIWLIRIQQECEAIERDLAIEDDVPF